MDGLGSIVAIVGDGPVAIHDASGVFANVVELDASVVELDASAVDWIAKDRIDDIHDALGYHDYHVLHAPYSSDRIVDVAYVHSFDSNHAHDPIDHQYAILRAVDSFVTSMGYSPYSLSCN